LAVREILLVNPSHSHAPHRASTIGMWLFLATLTMLFVSSMLAYFLIRSKLWGSAAPSHVPLPWGTWVSTVVLLGASYTIHRAVYNVRLERLNQLNFWLYITLGLSILFLLIQFPCLWEILREHFKAQNFNIHIYGMIFFLILLHAMHVVGGVIFMVMVTAKALRGGYDHENYLGVRHAALYWHFLDAVWIIMFGLLTITA
jgi:heme/copper-type cytochrome/quinol oxidase subunit 3